MPFIVTRAQGDYLSPMFHLTKSSKYQLKKTAKPALKVIQRLFNYQNGSLTNRFSSEFFFSDKYYFHPLFIPCCFHSVLFLIAVKLGL